MRTIALVLALLAPAAVGAGEWQVSEADPFGWRRALTVAGDDRLAVVCPPTSPPFAVPVAAASPDPRDGARASLGLEIDGERYDQPMTCSDVLCEAELPRETWRALIRGERVTLWIDDWRGPSFPLEGSADALARCSPNY
jgi:hypothetical protein